MLLAGRAFQLQKDKKEPLRTQIGDNIMDNMDIRLEKHCKTRLGINMDKFLPDFF